MYMAFLMENKDRWKEKTQRQQLYGKELAYNQGPCPVSQKRIPGYMVLVGF